MNIINILRAIRNNLISIKIVTRKERLETLEIKIIIVKTVKFSFCVPYDGQSSSAPRGDQKGRGKRSLLYLGALERGHHMPHRVTGEAMGLVQWQKTGGREEVRPPHLLEFPRERPGRVG